MLFATLALAGPIDAPQVMELELAPSGVVRVALPPDIVGADPLLLGQTMRLVNERGEEVPFTVALTEPLSRDEERLDIIPIGFGSWQVGPSERLVDGLALSFSDQGPYEVHVDNVGPSWVAQGLIDGELVDLDEVQTLPGHGPWVVRARNKPGDNLQLYSARGQSNPPDWVPPTCVEIPAGDPALRESGVARYALDLGGPRRVSSLAVHASGDLFDRTVTIGVPTDNGDNYGHQGRIRRIQIGGARIDRARIEDIDLGTDALVVDIATEDGRVLPVTGFTVCSIGAHLLAREVGAGRFQLYGGGEPHPEADDLAQAKVELLREAGLWFNASEEPVLPNPEYQQKADREGVAEVAAPLPLVKWRWSRPIEGEGWVRIPLDRAVLAHARDDLGDLRVVDSEGRQVPSLLRRTGRETAWDTAPFTREETGKTSRIRVTLGAELAPVATVRLATTGDTFRRTVRVLRDRGTITEPVRFVDWRGEQQGVNLAIGIDAVLGRELLIEIDNGDNPPLPVTEVSVSYPEWELRARVPVGARLLYGAPGVYRADYDLALLSADVFRQRLAVAALGAETEVGGPQLKGVQKGVMLGAVGVLALALLGLTGRVLLGGKPE